jgi:hypothetical protein
MASALGLLLCLGSSTLSVGLGLAASPTNTLQLRGYRKVDQSLIARRRWRVPDPLVSRSPDSNFCAIAPGLVAADPVKSDRVWNDRPMFIWFGAGVKLNLRVRGKEELFWSRNLDLDDRRVIYSGPPLRRGENYQWQIVFPQGRRSAVSRWYPVEVLSVADYNQYMGEWQREEAQLRQERADAEAIALEKAGFFMEQDLWSDALQILFELNNPSPALRQYRQDWLNYLCGSNPQAPSPNSGI